MVVVAGFGLCSALRRGGSRGRRCLLSLLAVVREHRRRLSRRARRCRQPARRGARGQGLRDRQSMGPPRRPCRGTRPPRFRGPSGGRGGRIVGGAGRPEVALYRGRRHGNHLGGRSGRGFRRRGWRRSRRGDGPGSRGDGQEPGGASPGAVGSGPSGLETGSGRPLGHGSEASAGRRVVETPSGVGSPTRRFAGQPGRSDCRGAGRRRGRFGGAATDHGAGGGHQAGRGCGDGSPERRSPGRVGGRRATGRLGTSRGPARRADQPPKRSPRADRRQMWPRPRWHAPRPRSNRPG